MAERKGLFGRLVAAGVRTATEAAGAVLRDPRGQDAVARAVGLAQRTQKRVEDVQARMMKVAGIPGRREYDELAKQLARIKRKARELGVELERQGAVRGGASAAPAAGAAPAGPEGEELRGPAAHGSAETPSPPPHGAGGAGGAGRTR